MKEAADRRQRLAAAAGEWNHNEFNFKTNHAREIKPLNDIKARYKQLSNSVMQDLYDVFRDVGMVEEILKMTFPMFLDQSAGIGQLGKILERGNLVSKSQVQRSTGS